MPLRLARNVRSLQRLRAIAQVLTKHGFGHLVERLDLSRFVPLWRKSQTSKGDQGHETQNIGQRLGLVCTELGPTFVKLGQMLSTRPDLLPIDIIDGLKRLQDRVDPFEADQAAAIIAQDLGIPASQAFKTFETNPFASGSIAQAHRAITRDDQPVVVKIKRPGIDDIIRDDMHLLMGLAEAIEHYIPELRVYHPAVIIDEFRRNMSRELDFINEASSTARFYEQFRGDGRAKVPEVRWDLTGANVLTFEYLEGIKLEHVLGNQDASVDRQQLAQNIAGVFVKQFFETGLFHADPHPGNMLISPPSTVGLVDFGLVGQVSDETMTQLMVALMAAVNHQVDWVVDVLAELGSVGPTTDLADLKRDMQALLNKYYGLPLKRIDLQTLFTEITEVVRRNDMALPREFVLLAKSLAMVAGTVLRLDPDLNLVVLLEPRLKGLLKKRFSMDQMGRTVGMMLWHVLNIAKNAPGQLRNAIRQLVKGQWQINIQHQNIDRLAQELDRSSNRLSFALIISSTIIGSSLMLAAGAETRVFGIELSWFGIVGYLFAALMGVWLVWAILRSGRLH